MSRKNSFIHTIAQAQSLAASFNTTPTVVSYQDNIAYQINITTSDSIGSFAVEASLDYVPAQANQPSQADSGTWVPLPLSGSPVVAAANDQIMIDLNQIPFKAIRLAYTSGTAGTGTAEILIACRTLGA